MAIPGVFSPVTLNGRVLVDGGLANNVPYDLGGRYFYVNDNGSVWNPGWKPVKAKDVAYECRHGLGYSRIIGEKDGLEVETLFFVPLGALPGTTLSTP